jgi:hypothetical protein
MKMSKTKRARVVRRVAIGAAAASAVGVAVAGVAFAARRTKEEPSKLPAPGATIETDLASKSIELVFDGQKINTGPLQGKATFEIESNKEDPSSVRTRISELYLTSQARRGGVTVTIQPTGNASNRSVLRRAEPGSPKLHHTVEMPLKITVRHPEALGLPAEAGGPLSLTTKDVATLVGKLNGFQTKGKTRYKLKDKVALSLPREPHRDVATILKFPVKIEGL